MSVIVFVWRPHYWPGQNFGVGHASIQINSQYISWFPQKHELKSAVRSPALHHTMQQDIAAEEGRRPGFVSAPIEGLDEDAMERWAKFIIAHGPSGKMEFEDIVDYRLFSTNCAGLVLRALLVGTKRDSKLVDLIVKLAADQVPQPLDCEAIARWMTR